MKTYFMIYHVKPSPTNSDDPDVSGSLAHIWIVDNSLDSAVDTAMLYLSLHNWEIVSVEQEPIETTSEQFAHSEIALKCFQRAQKDKIYSFFVGWTSEGENNNYEELRRLRP